LKSIIFADCEIDAQGVRRQVRNRAHRFEKREYKTLEILEINPAGKLAAPTATRKSLRHRHFVSTSATKLPKPISLRGSARWNAAAICR
jgi:hypothetical protein